MKLSDYRVDVEKEEKGAWVSIPGMPGFRVKVRSVNCEDYRAYAQAEARRFANTYGRQPIPPTETDQSTARGLVEYLLLDWDGVTGDDDKPVEFSKGLAMETLCDPAYRKVRDSVAWAAMRVGELESAFVEDAEKN